MRYQIDQSIKIEDTSRDSYVALANGKVVTIKIASKEKRKLKKYFRELNKPLIFKIFTFSFLCAEIIQKANIKLVEIDREYDGHEIDIKSFIVRILSMEGSKIPDINFVLVGKKSHAHEQSNKARKSNKSTIQVCAEEIIKTYKTLPK